MSSAPPGGKAPEDVTAVVVTYLRPTLAGDVVRGLVTKERVDPSRLVVVVNGGGGLDDPELERRVRTIRLPRNLGPAGGFRAGMLAAFEDPHVRWAYLCEDDVGLFDLPTPRLADLARRVARWSASHASGQAVGAVVGYGRVFVGRGAHTENLVPDDAVVAVDDGGLVPVDVACWGASLVSRAVVDAGVLPDQDWFFGLEDFDFFCRVREAGYAVLVDGSAARAVASQQTNAGRRRAMAGRRPGDEAEPWRAYYHARNSFALARRHGRPSWLAWHLLYSSRWLQKARSNEERRALVHGLWDGARGRMGENPRYRRTVGEVDPARRLAPSDA